MSDEEGFPKQLLEQSISERIAYFKNYTMAHPKLLSASQKLMLTLEEPAATSLMFLFGPTGIGKTTLLRRMTQKLLEATRPDMERDKGFIPIAGVETVTPEFSNFDWKDFYLRALTVLKDPCIELPISQRMTNLKLRMSVESALRHRRLKVFYIDEAQNLSKVASGRKLRDQTDCIKSLANITRVQFILAGTYELLILRNLSAQLCRRSQDIHLERYKADNSEDLRAFQGIVQTFQRHLPLQIEPDLLKHWDFCYERCVGCIGILKDWLSRALFSALLKGDKTLTFSDLESHALKTEQCIILLNEALHGEEQLNSRRDTNALRAALGLEVATDMTPKTSQTSAKTTRRHAVVGQPLPQRRPVGGGHNAC